MDIPMQYRAYELVKKLTEQGFRIIAGDYKTDEIWLERKIDRKSAIVRVKPQTFDWANRLRQDLQIAYQQMQRIRQAIARPNATFYSIYIAQEQPVDDWEDLKEPQGEGTKKSPKMHVYYLVDGDETEKMSQLNQDLHISLPLDKERHLTDTEKEAAANDSKNMLFQKIQEEQDKRKKIFSFSKPLFTYILIALNVLIFIFQLTSGDMESIRHLIDLGANYNVLVMEGEWWRFFTSMFLHLDFLHLMMNMLALFYLGTTIERVFGRIRFIMIYFLGGLTGSIASFAFSIHVSAGASGAIFALFGALLLFGLLYKQIFFQTMGAQIMLILGINLILGFTVPEIDMAAHLGGLAGGFFIAAAAYVPNKKSRKHQFLGLISYLVLSLGLFIYGWSFQAASPELKLIEAERQIEENNFTEVISITTEALEQTDDSSLIPYFLFHRSYAYIQESKYVEAVTDLEEAIHYEERVPEMYHNLAVLYSELGAGTADIEAIIDEGLEYFPDNEELTDLKNQLSSY
ncbi:rhomboid family intramembrane serine protease [Oceanobacillus sp. CFH 90083]|uniref:rhomboid family intramembrane serine protease n=1 Tax=Oceanobacillus sp. CFH 90083 TaxID=2592336 RepID=UPI00128C271D|nr:rhomboid family intramembrane serine protease [Oceanobacillus sp. CFH 90083]